MKWAQHEGDKKSLLYASEDNGVECKIIIL